jgi:hypothetical protein
MKGSSAWDGIIYNITVKADAQIADAWLQWMLQEHIPEIMQTGCFTDHRVVRLLDINESDGLTYAIQYHAASKADHNRYMELHAPVLQKKSYAKWGDRFIAFASLMEVVH